jgi:hypothetical protein
LIVALHAAQHGDRWQPLHDGDHWLQPVHDLHRALERVDLETWRRADALAWELGAGPEFAAGLRLDPTGADVADRLGVGDTTPRVVRLLGTPQPPTAWGLERLISTRVPARVFGWWRPSLRPRAISCATPLRLRGAALWVS